MGKRRLRVRTDSLVIRIATTGVRPATIEIFRNTIVIIGMVAWFSFASYVILRLEQERQAAKKEQQADASRQTAATTTSLPPEPKENGANNQSPDRYPWIWTDAGAEWALFVVGSIGLYAAIRSLRAIQSQVRIETRALRASVLAANAATEGSKLTKATLKNSQRVDRAWVSLESLDIDPLHEAMTIVIGLKNSGRTPAYIHDANVTVTIATDDAFLLPEFPEYEVGRFAPPVILVAGEKTRWRCTMTMETHPGVVALNPGDDARFWIYGTVLYSDVFNPTSINRRHIYRWGREYDPLASVMTQRFRFAHMSGPNFRNYNYAD